MAYFLGGQYSGGLFSQVAYFLGGQYSGGLFSQVAHFLGGLFSDGPFSGGLFSGGLYSLHRIIKLTNKAGDDLMNSNTIKSFKWKIKQWVKSNIKVKPIAKGNSLSIEVSGASFQGG